MNDEYRGLLSGRPAFTALIIYASGILVAVYLPFQVITFIFITLALAIASLISHLKTKSMLGTWLIYVCIFLAGIAQQKIAVSDFPPTHVRHIAEEGATATVIGEIAEEPDIRSDRTYIIIEIDSLIWRDIKFKSSGRLILKVNQSVRNYAYNDRLSFKGYLFEPGGAQIPGGFDYGKWLEHKEIFGMIVVRDTSQVTFHPQQLRKWWHYLKFWDLEAVFINKLVAPLRETLLDGYDKYLPSDQASLLAGFVLGEKRDMPEDIVGLFRDTGTLHLMAVSGSNVAIVVGFVLAITFWMKRRLRIIITILAVIFFCFLTRNEPSVVRASVMAAVGLIGFYNRPNPDMLGLLGFSGLILLIINPLWLFNIGFQLSYAACGGIIYFMPIATGFMKKSRGLVGKAAYWTLFTFLATLSAQIAVLPLTAEYFNRVPIVGVIANIPMILLASVLTIAGICFLPFVLLGDFLASIYTWPLSKIMSCIIPLLEFFVKLPYSVINVSSPGWLKIILFYSFLYVLTELAIRKRLSFKTSYIALSVSAILIWLSYLSNPDEDSLTFIDCSDDRAVLFNTSEGKSYLWYDIHNNDQYDHLEKSLLPFLFKTGQTKIDTVFTNNKSNLASIYHNIKIGEIIEHNSLIVDSNISNMAFPRHTFSESILTNKVKFVTVETDNNTETVTDGHYYKLTTSGGECILAGIINPQMAFNIVDHKAKVLELPWSVQPYGAIYESIKENPPLMLIFSPDKNTVHLAGRRERLTYYNDRTWSVEFAGSFRIRLSDKMHVDYMLKP